MKKPYKCWQISFLQCFCLSMVPLSDMQRCFITWLWNGEPGSGAIVISQSIAESTNVSLIFVLFLSWLMNYEKKDYTSMIPPSRIT